MYERLNEWNSMYLLLLKIIIIKQDFNIQNKFRYFIEWSIEKFRLSITVIFFAAFIFSGNPPKNFNKYKKESDKVKRKESLFNMTWDLYIVNNYIQSWKTKKENVEIMFSSADNGLKKFMRSLIKYLQCGDLSIFNSFFNQKESSNIIDTMNGVVKNSKRIYLSENWTPEYRDNLIYEFEEVLLS